MTDKIYHKGKMIDMPARGMLPSREVAQSWLEHETRDLYLQGYERLGLGRLSSERVKLLDENEERMFHRATDALRALRTRLGLHPLELLAAESKKEDEVEAILDDYHGRVYNLSEIDKLRLAFRLLDEVVGEEMASEFRQVAAGEARVEAGHWRRHDAPIHVCPWCDGNGSYRDPHHRYRRVDCVRCEDGFVYAEDESEIEDESEVPSEAACIAISDGQPWSLEQEVEAQGYDTIADYLEHEGEEALAEVRTNLELAERFRRTDEEDA